MKCDQFVYWLQGYFEITKAGDTDLVPILTVDQIACIRNHIALVREVCETTEEQMNQFIPWLDGLLLCYEHVPDDKKQNTVNVVLQGINSVFEHVIDPTIPGDKDALQAIHDGKADDKPVTIRQGTRTGSGFSRGKALERGWGGGGRGRFMC